MLNSDKSDIPSLTGLRFIAAMSVAIAHGAGITLRFGSEHTYIIDWLGRGTAFGMTLFFVLSGFVIHLNYRTSVTQGGFAGIGAFIWARFVRLYPLFLLLLVVDFWFHISHAAEIHQPDVQLRALPYYLLSIQSWVYEPIRNHSLIYSIGMAVPVTWSISTEWFFYLAFPFIAPVVLLFRRPAIALSAAVLWCAFWAACIVALHNQVAVIEPWAVARYGDIASMFISSQDSYYRWLFYFSPYVRIGEFVLGCIVAQLYLVAREIPVRKIEQVVGIIFLVIAVTTIIFITVIMYLDAVAPLVLIKLRNSFAVAPSVAILIFCMARYRSALSQFASSKWMTKFGDASYELYLIHIPIFVIVVKLSEPVLGGEAGVTNSLLRFAIGMALLLFASVLLHRTFDVPVRRWLKVFWTSNNVIMFGQTGRRLARYMVAAPVVIALGLFFYISYFMPALAVDGGVSVVSATYGKACGGSEGNATNLMRRVCDGQTTCAYDIDQRRLKRLRPDCSPLDFTVEYQCASDPQLMKGNITQSTTTDRHMFLWCANDAKIPNGPQVNGLRILSATYGASCGVPQGNATKALASTCTGLLSCAYRIDVAKLGDPASGCAKDYQVEYRCGEKGIKQEFVVPGEAGLGDYAVLSCSPSATEKAH